MAVAFLPVFYSKHALNDVVTLAPLTVGARRVPARLRARPVGRLGARRRRRSGSATATKYTAGAMLLTLAVAAGLRVLRDRARAAPRRCSASSLAGAACLAVFAILNPYALLDPSEARGQIGGQSAQADTAKLGQDDTYGWLYYLGTLTWGLRLAAARSPPSAGAVVALRRDWRRAAAGRLPRLLLPLHGRAGALLRALAAAHLPGAVRAGRLRGGRRRRRAALAPRRGARRPRPRCCASQGAAGERPRRPRARAARTRAQQALAGSARTSRPGAPSWSSRSSRRPGAMRCDRPVWPVERPFQAYEKRLRVRHIERYREQGYCWVIVGTHAEGARAEGRPAQLAQLLPALDEASEETVTFSPFARRRRPGRVLLRRLVQLPAAGLRAARAGGRDPPAARLSRWPVG